MSTQSKKFKKCLSPKQVVTPSLLNGKRRKFFKNFGKKQKTHNFKVESNKENDKNIDNKKKSSCKRKKEAEEKTNEN